MRAIPATAAALVLALTTGCEQQPTTTAPGTTQVATRSSSTVAPGTTIEFRVVAEGRNPSGCTRFDAALARVHTFTATSGGGATLQTAGGVRSVMTQTSPGIYTTRLGIGGTNFDVVANASTSPRRLDVTEPKLGCRWNAVAP